MATRPRRLCSKRCRQADYKQRKKWGIRNDAPALSKLVYRGIEILIPGAVAKAALRQLERGDGKPATGKKREDHNLGPHADS
jgi:hypothetical protein